MGPFQRIVRLNRDSSLLRIVVRCVYSNYKYYFSNERERTQTSEGYLFFFLTKCSWWSSQNV